MFCCGGTFFGDVEHMLNDDPPDVPSLPIEFCNAYKICNLLQLHKYSTEIVNVVICHGGEIFLYAQQDQLDMPLVHDEVTETVDDYDSDNIISEKAIVQQLQLEKVEESVKHHLLPTIAIKWLSMVLPSHP